MNDSPSRSFSEPMMLVNRTECSSVDIVRTNRFLRAVGIKTEAASCRYASQGQLGVREQHGEVATAHRPATKEGIVDAAEG